mmetsp:Transcript_47822/g.124092  ORF Transcript_47822/g.124092 Transcript_47822/m.124092 type:complete len:228 (+) Transcript_47822:1330-2013(+)
MLHLFLYSVQYCDRASRFDYLVTVSFFHFPLYYLGIWYKHLITLAVPAFMHTLINRSFFNQNFPHFLYYVLVPLFSSANEVVILHIQLFEERAKRIRIDSGEFDRAHLHFFRTGRHLLAVLIRACREENIVTSQPQVARDGIGQHCSVCVSDVRPAIHVEDGRRHQLSTVSAVEVCRGGACSQQSGCEKSSRWEGTHTERGTNGSYRTAVHARAHHHRCHHHSTISP